MADSVYIRADVVGGSKDTVVCLVEIERGTDSKEHQETTEQAEENVVDEVEEQQGCIDEKVLGKVG